MNLATKIVVGAKEGKLMNYIWRFSIKRIFGFVYLIKTKQNNDEIIQIDS